jgi:hypothetical protein
MIEFTFDPEKPELIAKFKEIDPSGRIRDRETMISFLAKTYQFKMAEQITNFFFRHYF